MNKTELIDKIAGNLSIPESEQKLFFELLLKRCSEVLNPGESLTVPGLGKFEYRKSFDENDLIVFVSNDNEELPFDIPRKENENFPIDSYFSISIGKPVIPLKGLDQNEFLIPHSGDEMNRFLELKVERFIEEASKNEIESEEQENSDIADIQFSFLNWKRSSNMNEEINQIEKELDDSFNPEFNEIGKTENEIEGESLIEVETEKIESMTPEADIEEIKEDEEELMETTEEWVNDLIDESKNIKEEIPEEIKITSEDDFTSSVSEDKEAEIPSYKKVEEKINVEDDTSVINEAFKYAEDKKVRIESYRKRSYGGFIFAAVIIIATAAVVYFSYYFTGREETPVTLQNSEPKEFKVVIERSFDIPVSYPYQSGMFAGIYDAINDDILNPVVTEEQSSEQSTEIADNGNSKVPEIRSVLPSKRVKDYIYQYNDGTFAVQLSSWKSKTIALSETQKFLDKGYNAFIEETGISGGTFYRVRVGGFKSLKEAEDFSRK